KPFECQSMRARFRRTVGLCVEKLLVNSETAVSAVLPQNPSWFWSSKNSLRMTGCAASVTSIRRGQPHRQPWLSKVNVPYPSSVVSASRRLGTCTAEWLFGQSFDDGSKNGPEP